MRIKKVYKRICIEQDVYDAIIKARNKYNETYDLGKWSISDVLREWNK